MTSLDEQVSTTPATGTPPPRLRWLQPMWRDRWIAAGVGAGLAAVSGGIAGLVMPRGPVTPAHVVVAMLTGAAVGVACGVLLRSRWAMLLAPVTYAAAFELTRLDASGPTVDGVTFTPMGLAVAGVGRGFHGLVGLLPMVVGAAYGAGLARRVGGTARPSPRSARVGLAARRTVAAVTVLGLVVLAGVVLRPASTPAVVDAAGHRVPGSIAELTTVRLGGHEQALMLRGYSTANPVLLYLTGGPGGTDFGLNRVFWRDLERRFVVVSWDQRGVAKSYPSFEPAATLDVEHAVRDAVALAEYLRARFHQPKVYLVGHSWGSTLGVLAAQRRPDLFAAYVGVGQMVSQTETDRIIYRQRLDKARREGDSGQLKELQKLGPPPYADVFAYLALLGDSEELEPYQQRPAYTAAMPGGMNGTMVREYTLLEQVNALRSMADTFLGIYEHLGSTDLRRDAPSLAMPVYFVLGGHELTARSTLARDYFTELHAPAKHLVVFPDSGHAPHHEDGERFAALMTTVARDAPATN